jgi:hypothetical protein
MAIDDETGPQVVSRQLLPDVVVVSRHLQMRTIAQVGAHSGASLHGLPNSLGARGCVTNSYNNPRRNKLFDHL